MTDTDIKPETDGSLDLQWKALLADEFASPYMQDLKQFLQSEKALGKRIFPLGKEYFRALNLTPPDKVKVVILGQDPYHGEGQAHGLCFSVRPGVRIPPSLVNIYKELDADLGVSPAKHGFLEAWAHQGVLLLNSVLTVEEGKAAAHQGKGWERFTDAVIARVNQLPQPVVFILWGTYAQKKASFVDPSRHLILKSAHPSPLSAYNGFLGSRPFSRANAWLDMKGVDPIEWQLPENPHV